MNPGPIKILLVEDNPSDARLLREVLQEMDSAEFEMIHVERLSEALDCLARKRFDVILSDLSLPDTYGLETLIQLHEQAPGIPIIVLTGNDDETLGLKAVQTGAQDYLTKGKVDCSLLVRTIRYAIERHRMGVELEQTRRQQLEMKDQFLSHVSHELRSPLTTIYQFTTILVDGLGGYLNPEQHEYMGIVLRNVDQLRTMINDLLDITRAQTGKLTLEPEYISLVELIADTVRALKKSATAKEITLSADPLRYLPPVYVDPARIRQVLVNLVDNAIKFTPEQGRVTLRAGFSEEEPGFLRIEIEDTGCGISPEGCLRIFDRMYQEQNHVESSRKGLGLGLHISKELISRHGGHISVESRLGQGSIFYFTLPACSLAAYLSPVLTENDALRTDISLLTVELVPRDRVPVGMLKETVRQQAWHRLQQCFPAYQSLLLPRMVSTEQREAYFIVIGAGPQDVENMAQKVRAHLAGCEDFLGAGLDWSVSARPITLPYPSSAAPLEQQLEAATAAVNALMKTVAYEMEGATCP
jgi:signal transduction histidine kinase